jgi:CRISPR/Cas system-associated exonuclease Cas4 (RecB family)
VIQRYSVSDARMAIACPRIFYFDAMRFKKTGSKKPTKLWSGKPKAPTACGALFHNAMERLYVKAERSKSIRQMLVQASERVDGPERCKYIFGYFKRFILTKCVNRKSLAAKSPEQRKAFTQAVSRYVRELATILDIVMSKRRAPDELYDDFFGDARRRVDVTFHVGTGKEPVRVSGIIDYVYYDPLMQRDRIIDFKLLDVDSTERDALQVALYALMHNQQHGTTADVAVIYLVDGCKIIEYSWGYVEANRQTIMDLLESMAAWAEFDEKAGSGLKPFGNRYQCAKCPWNGQCERRLGPISEGAGLGCWARVDEAHASAVFPDASGLG